MPISPYPIAPITWLLTVALCAGTILPARSDHQIKPSAILIAPAKPLPIDTFMVNDIQLEGLDDIEANTVFTYLPIKIGDLVTPEKVQSAIQNLYGTRLFDKVSMSRIQAASGNVLLVTLQERQVIGELEIEGTYEFAPDKMKESLRGAGLSEGKLLDPVLLLLAEQELKRQYVSRGYYGVKVRHDIQVIEKRRVKVSLIVNEGDIALIDKIKIFGNNIVGTSELRGLMDSTDSAIFDSSKRYSREKLDADLDRIRAHYLNKGYLDFQLDTAQVSISVDLEKITIAIGVREGESYTIRGIELVNPTELLNEATFIELNEIDVGDTYTQKEVAKLDTLLRDHLAKQGFAQARTEIQTVKSSNPKEHTVLLRYGINTGPRMTIRNINVVGNNRTSDEVIRREFRLREGDLFNSTLLNKSRQRIERLNFFSEVSLNIQPTSSSFDQIDIETKVTEKRTGNFQFGISSSNLDSVGLNASIQQDNWLGSGRSIGLSFNTARSTRSLNASYYEPYLTNWGLGMGLSAYQTNDDSSSLSTANYIVKTTGIGIRFNYSLSDDSSIGFGLRGAKDSYTIFTNSPTTYIDFTNQFGLKPYDLTWNVGYSLDKRDSFIYPTKGIYFRLNQQRALSNSDLQYQYITSSFQIYIPVSESISILLNTDIGKVIPLKNQPIPFTKNVYSGGIRSIRGYEYGTVGPFDATTGRYTGGDRNINTNIEVLLPFPGTKRSREARIAIFYDIGGTWAREDNISDRKQRASYGIALSWQSPIGPLRFSYGIPISVKPSDRIQRFQFQAGTSF